MQLLIRYDSYVYFTRICNENDISKIFCKENDITTKGRYKILNNDEYVYYDDRHKYTDTHTITNITTLDHCSKVSPQKRDRLFLIGFRAGK